MLELLHPTMYKERTEDSIKIYESQHPMILRSFPRHCIYSLIITLKLKPSRLSNSLLREKITIFRYYDPWGQVLADCGGLVFLTGAEDGQIGGEGFIAVYFEQNTQRLELLSRNIGVLCIGGLVGQQSQEIRQMVFDKIKDEDLLVADIKDSGCLVARRVHLFGIGRYIPTCLIKTSQFALLATDKLKHQDY